MHTSLNISKFQEISNRLSKNSFRYPAEFPPGCQILIDDARFSNSREIIASQSPLLPDIRMSTGPPQLNETKIHLGDVYLDKLPRIQDEFKKLNPLQPVIDNLSIGFHIN